MSRYLLLILMLGVFSVAPESDAVPLQWYTVGNAGNASDHSGLGAVDYRYRISEEIRISDYLTFLDFKESQINEFWGEPEYHFTLDPRYPERPAIMFEPKPDAYFYANWVNNGKGDGDITTGAYTITNNAGVWSYLENPDAKVRLPNLDEWYKARYIEGVPLIHEYVTNPQPDDYYFGGEWLTGNWLDVFPDVETISSLLNSPFVIPAESILQYNMNVWMAETVNAPIDLYNGLPLTPSGTFRLVEVIPEPSTLVLFVLPAMALIRKRAAVR